MSQPAALSDAPAGWTPRVQDGAWTRTLRSSANGHDYRLSLALPSAPPPGPLPIIYLLDGEALFAGVAETLGRLARRPAVTGVGPAALVGIGRANEDAYDAAARKADFTEGSPLLEFLTGEVAPLVEALVPVDPGRRALLGHSLAGYFALEALARSPGAFAAFGAISPSLWRDEAGLSARLEAAELSARKVFLAVGEREEPAAPANADQARRARRRMVSSLRDLAGRLEARLPAGRLRVHILADEDHASVVGPAAVRFLRFLGEA